MQADPLITAEIRDSAKFSPLPYILILVIFIAVLILGMILTPSSSGFGTHEALGLPPCGFLVITGYPCPSCGLTTAFALLLHGRVIEALMVQPFGVILFLCLFVAAGLSFVGLYLRLPFSAFFYSRYMERIQMILLTVMLISWFYKIYIMKWM